ncbi:MAG TPA: class I SAM-dependent methyltransferase [Acidimicrobiales bacterium]|jgi:tRNA (mo5U34)-methyltransferase|nr:class I SAM-dependent methyltransferase [Acidimicrobiales bacterium]
MPSWRKKWHGYSIEFRYPERTRNQPGELAHELATTPTRQPPLVREPQRALDFLRAPALQGDGKSPNPVTQEYLADAQRTRASASTLTERVASIPWYHTIDLGHGVVTPGNHDHRSFVSKIGIPDNLEGKRVLDVATFDGFWAFEFERRGASVVAIDLPSTAHLDLVRGAREIVEAEHLDTPHGEAFSIAHDALDSKVSWLPSSVYDLDPAVHGTFDLVFVGDVLLHLRNPLDALRRIRSVTTGDLIVVDRFDPSISGSGERLLRYEGGWHSMEWWAPSLETLEQWVVDAGFSAPRMQAAYRVRGVDRSQSGWHRAILHSRAA